MNTHSIPYSKTGYFSKLIVDYLNREEGTIPFYENYPDKEGFKNQIKQKQSFDIQNRKVLVKELKNQYQSVEISSKVRQNIEVLSNSNTFTVTTGHQLNIFTGPLYFLYKIVTTINLSKQLQQFFPEFSFVPVYWMATEDHDFDEINHFNYENEQFVWHKKAKGTVGSLNTEGLQKVLEEFSSKIGNSKRAKELCGWFETAYLKHNNLAEATRFLVNKLFGSEGIIVLDAHKKSLKKLFKSSVKNELIHQAAYKSVSDTSFELKKEYNLQVNPRKINLFYTVEGLRDRIIVENGVYKINNHSISFTLSEILEQVEQHPERFSPNVIMRPLYQETILPNLCYIGGGGELAYWFQLKKYFQESEIPFPILLLRNSVLLITKKQLEKAKKMHISVEELFLNQQELQEKKVKEISKIPIDFSSQKKYLAQQFTELKEIAKQTDKSFIGAVNAQEKKQLNGLEKLEKRLLKAQKRRLQNEIQRINNLQNQLFPQQSLQERYTNFSEFYMKLGKGLFPLLVNNLQALNHRFLVIEIDEFY